MREIVFDTETTGLDFEADRVIEIGGLELWNHVPTGKVFHRYVRPVGRRVDPDAFRVHGISDDMLSDKPTFGEIVEEFEAFFGGARLVAHNATFDLRFLNAELARLERPPIEADRIVDTLAMARRKFPMANATLDALCSRFSIDTSKRTKHGALLDSELLADVYLELLGGRQSALGLVVVDGREPGGANERIAVPQRLAPLASRLTPEEAARHRAFVATLGSSPAWMKLLEPADEAAQKAS
ncbi:DNA polymerase III subunit epsilon [Aurantimonas sp. Leaf443]|uniref:DNA polymerase III subunit epsilon n=1 Tax=Aurantimonas sp. Leaf443 TaxID=1736378 RepID=UPI0006FAEA2A|nr:DNA polymerase III subunit epsilon [Aurantimonas sp. Leaf443]KQT85550.1 DNA polymerase III subunit epsilon [Aurantimonas sp. Leaf443]